MKIIIADDQRILAEGLKLLLSQEPDIEVIGLCENGEEAVFAVETLKPDAVLMDIQMPIMNGVEAIKRIRAVSPETKCLILTTFSDDAYIYEGILNGAAGYLLKDASPQEIAKALRIVHEGGALFEPQIAAKMLKQFNELASGHERERSSGPDENLTEREEEIAALVAEGFSNLEIGERLFLTEGTVKNNLSRILQKLALRDRTQLAIYWIKRR